MKTSILMLALAISLPSAAVAQTPPQQPPPPPQQPAPPPPPSRPLPREVYRISPLDLDEARSFRRTGSPRALAGQRRERVIFANRLAQMANAGDCPGALRAALDAGDRVIAQRLYQACRRPD